MGYYTGDYMPPGFRGRPRGDFLGSLGSVIGRVASAGLARLEGVISGTPAAAATTAIARMAPRVGTIVRGVGGAIQRHPVLSAAGAAGVVGALTPRAPRAAIAEVPGGVGARRYRRINVCNIKALRRSLRRIHGFAKIARRVYHVSHPRPGTRTRFRFARRKKRTI